MKLRKFRLYCSVLRAVAKPVQICFQLPVMKYSDYCWLQHHQRREGVQKNHNRRPVSAATIAPMVNGFLPRTSQMTDYFASDTLKILRVETKAIPTFDDSRKKLCYL